MIGDTCCITHDISFLFLLNLAFCVFIGAIIHTCQETLCLPYSRFFTNGLFSGLAKDFPLSKILNNGIFNIISL